MTDVKDIGKNFITHWIALAIISKVAPTWLYVRDGKVLFCAVLFVSLVRTAAVICSFYFSCTLTYKDFIKGIAASRDAKQFLDYIDANLNVMKKTVLIAFITGPVIYVGALWLASKCISGFEIAKWYVYLMVFAAVTIVYNVSED